MGLLFKPWAAHEGGRDTNSQVWNQQEELEKICREEITVSAEDMIGSSSHRNLTEDEHSGGRMGPDFPHCDNSPPRDDSSFLILRHPLLGPFQNFPGTQFWVLYWQRKKMIKLRHQQVLTKNMSGRNFQRCVRDMINHHMNLLQSIDNQKRDGLAKGPLLYLLLDDHAQLLIASKLVLQYFQIIRMPLILSGQNQNRPIDL